jgi:hypothetical protein
MVATMDIDIDTNYELKDVSTCYVRFGQTDMGGLEHDGIGKTSD